MHEAADDVEQQPLLELDPVEAKEAYERVSPSLELTPTTTQQAWSLSQLLSCCIPRWMQVLIPSFLKSNPKATRKNGIAALDGLRGLACMAVFNEHFISSYQSRDTSHWINWLAIVRLWRFGRGAVCLFFVS